MKALTLWQPYATLVALRVKRWETRSWRTEHRGLLAIHAAARMPRGMRAVCEQPAFRYALRGVRRPFVRGAVVAIVDVLDCRPTGTLLDQLDLGFGADDGLLAQFVFGDFTPGRFAWPLGNIRRLKEPIPANGAQRLWEWKAPRDWERLVAA